MVFVRITPPPPPFSRDALYLQIPLPLLLPTQALLLLAMSAVSTKRHDVELFPTGIDAEPEPFPPFKEGDLVFVERRMWPGINKPGGVGKIKACTCTSATVKYILGGTDKEIPLHFVSLNEDVGKREVKPVVKDDVTMMDVVASNEVAVTKRVMKAPPAKSTLAKIDLNVEKVKKHKPAPKIVATKPVAKPQATPTRVPPSTNALDSLATVAASSTPSPLSTGVRITEISEMPQRAVPVRPTVPLNLLTDIRGMLNAQFSANNDMTSLATLRGLWISRGNDEQFFDDVMAVMADTNVVMMDGDDIYKI